MRRLTAVNFMHEPRIGSGRVQARATVYPHMPNYPHDAWQEVM